MTTVQDYPQSSETAFLFPDIRPEAKFIQSCITKYSGIPVRRVFEVGCGCAPHVGELAKLGYSYAGLDSNRSMLDFAVHEWSHLEPAPEFIQGDTVLFALDRRIDFAFVMHGSLYLKSLKEMISHFDSMASTLHHGGLYLIDWCIQFAGPLTPMAISTPVSESHGPRVRYLLINNRLTDHAGQALRKTQAGDTPRRRRHNQLKIIKRNRDIFPQEFQLFIRSLSDFEFVGWWKDWDLSQPIAGDSEADRSAVLLMRK